MSIQLTAVYPPYQTDVYQTCPLKWDLSKRWKRREGSPKVAMLVGNAIALGLEVFLRASGRDPFAAAAALVDADYLKGSDKSLKGTQELVRVGVELGIATNLGLSRVLNVEDFFGRIKPDLVGRDHADELVVVDHKVKMNLDDRWLEKELLGFDTSNQFFQYAHFVGTEYGEPVARVIAHVIVLAPIPRSLLHPVTMSREALDFWLSGAATHWNEMKQIENGVEDATPRFTGCQTKYGPCDFYDGCHIYHGDESAFPVLYDRAGRG